MKRKPGKKMNPYLRALLCAWIGAVLTVVLTLIAGKLLLGGLLPMKQLDAVCWGIRGISVTTACLAAALSGKKTRLLCSALAGGGYLVLLCCANALFWKGSFQELAPNAILIAGAILLGAVISSLKRKAYAA